MNQTTLTFLIEIMRSDLSRQTKDDIVRFFSLPRNTPVKALVEIEDNESEAGAIKRPTQHTIDRKNNPKMADEEDAIKETLDGRV